MSERVNPFGDLGDFAPIMDKQKLPIDEEKVIEQLVAENNFPSRQPARSQPPIPEPTHITRKQRRYITGRNKQINIKATDQTIYRLHRVADKLGLPLGEVLARAQMTHANQQDDGGRNTGEW